MWGDNERYCTMRKISRLLAGGGVLRNRKAPHGDCLTKGILFPLAEVFFFLLPSNEGGSSLSLGLSHVYKRYCGSFKRKLLKGRRVSYSREPDSRGT